MDLRSAFPSLARHLPEPLRALRLARLLIPLSIFFGLAAEPALRWFLRSLEHM